MELFHVSEHGEIEVFEPRTISGGDSRKLVWSVDSEHLCNYLLPRDCPRVCFRTEPRTSAADRERFFASGPAPVVVIEAGWFDRAVAKSLWVYAMPDATFAQEDKNAGYFVSSSAVRPANERRIASPLAELVALGAELRVVPNLQHLAEAVVQSTLAFSCIRMRNALR